MIKKLMKYDIKNMITFVSYIYIISIGLAIITRLFNIGRDIQVLFIISQIFASLTYSAIASILVNTVVHILKVFICSFYKDESYLTHTLPVSKGKLLLSKYLSSLIVILCSVAVSFLSIFIIFYTPNLMETLSYLISATVAGFNMPGWLFVTLFIFVIFSQICSMMSMGFASIIIANKYNSKRVFKGLLWFFLFYFGSLYVTLMFAVIIFAISGNLGSLFVSQLSQSSFLTLLILALVLYAIYSFVFYFIARKQFNKGVNVD